MANTELEYSLLGAPRLKPIGAQKCILDLPKVRELSLQFLAVMYGTQAANLLARAWNQAPGLQGANTPKAAKADCG